MTLPSYAAVHLRLRKRRGSANTHPCIACQQPAQQWAYQHSAAEPMFSEVGEIYSADLDDYAAMCARCHQALDEQEDPALAERRRAGLALGPRAARPVIRERLRTDQEFRAAWVARSRSNAGRRRCCAECGMESNPPGLGRHQKATGHQGY